MPDAISIGGPFVLYKPEGTKNYFFYDAATGARVYGNELEAAKIYAQVRGIVAKGENFDMGTVYVEEATMNAWKAQNPGAAMKSMPDPGHFQQQFPPPPKPNVPPPELPAFSVPEKPASNLTGIEKSIERSFPVSTCWLARNALTVARLSIMFRSTRSCR